MPPDTIAVEVHRGPLVESRHAGRVAVARDDGSMVFVWGDAATPVYPRSAIKALQALPLVESGAADAYGFDDAALALACASHNGAAEHVAVADRMLACAGVGPDDLGCGAHWPYEQSSLIALARSGGTPSALHNNCSGKHAGFLALARRRGHPLAGYVTADHPVQVEVRGAVEAMTGAALGTDVCGTDGCSIPTYAIPLDRLALAFARFGTGRGLPAQRAEAARRLRVAVAAHPDMVAGEGRFCTRVMRHLGARAFVKTGAEGVFCASLPDLGLGIALKCDDGAMRAAEVMVAAVIAAALRLNGDPDLGAFVAPAIRNWNGIETGRIAPAAPFDAALSRAF